MSRIGYKEIEIPEGVTVEINKGGLFNNQIVKVTGPKGTLEQSIKRGVTVNQEDSKLTLTRADEAKQTKSYHGLFRSLINNMIIGVTEGYSRDLEIVGIGYRAEMQGNKAVFSVGYSHKIELVPPEGITITVDEQTKVKVEGIDKQLVGEIAAKIRAYRKPEPYKGKGIRYADEIVKKKSVKNVASA